METGTAVTVFCLDLAEEAARRRAAELLQPRCAEVQRGVFEGRLEAAEAAELFDRLRATLDPGDRLRMYALSAWGLERSRAAGGAPLAEEAAFWLL